MKDKIKDIFLVILYIVGMFFVMGLYDSLTKGDLSDTSIGKIVQTLAVIAGLVIFGFLAFCWVATIFVAIRDYFKGKIQAEVRKEIARQKYLEKQKRNDE